VKLFKKISLLGIAALGLALSGCLNDSGPSASGEDATLVISTSVKDINKVNGLGKASVITLRKLIITLTSDSSDVRRDTVLADTGSMFSSTSTSDQSFSRSYALKPLRNWKVVVKTLDANDSVIHKDSATTPLLAGQTKSVTLNLASRYVMYEAKFSLPDTLRYTQSGLALQLFINRVKLLVDGKVVTDSTALPRFNPSTTTPPATIVHTVRFDYISVKDTPDVRVEFYGHIGSDTTTRKMFDHVFENVDPSNPNPPPAAPTYTGPNANELNGNVGLVINIGRVGTVIFNTNIPGNVNLKQGSAP
jgi:hypothetical protein